MTEQEPEREPFHRMVTALWFLLAVLAIPVALLDAVNADTGRGPSYSPSRILFASFCFFVLGYFGLIYDAIRMRNR